MCRAPRAARQQDNNNEMKMEIQKNRSMYEYYFPPHMPLPIECCTVFSSISGMHAVSLWREIPMADETSLL